MKIKSVNIKNIASFVDFKTSVELQKKSLIFGTNGSGKSTLSSLMQMVDDYYKKGKSQEKLNNIKNYLDNKCSKESLGKDSKLQIEFTSKQFELTYSMQSGELVINNDNWFPVRVFNDKYTQNTIGDTVDINLVDNDLIIGEPNKNLDFAQKRRDGLLKKRDAFELQIESTIESSLKLYKDKTHSSANISSIISKENLLSADNEYKDVTDAVENRNKLGFDTPVDNLKEITHKEFNQIIMVGEYESIFNEKIEKPILNKNEEDLLLNFTEFYKIGMIAANELDNKCPFCFQDWSNSKIKINSYKEFLESTYNNQKDLVIRLRNKVINFNDEISRVNSFIVSVSTLVKNEGLKYDIKTDNFTVISINEDLINNVLDAIETKLSDMTQIIDISSKIKTLFSFYENEIKKRNDTIDSIKDFISKIRSKRTTANKEVSKQLMSDIWINNNDKRKNINETVAEIITVENEIKEIEKLEIDDETICTIFNGLISFLGLSEYKINIDKKLVLSLNREYVITNEGSRISSAQKKILSLCYFIAEIISELKSENDLRNYILVFDDPVDSADYNYFHSITALLENLEIVLQRILKKRNLKVGQVIVLTHNSLLHDRLAQNFDLNKTIKKVDNFSVMTSSEKTTNNYKTYLEYIIRYYKNPKSNKKDMIFIGNIIRRVLEILSNFNNLDSNNFRDFILGIGKPKLAIISNHLSHESFTKVLNPLSSEDELQEACKELLEVIQESHPEQYKFIEKEMLN